MHDIYSVSVLVSVRSSALPFLLEVILIDLADALQDAKKADEPIYVGIDIGKMVHYCGFASKSLLAEKT
jgi:hypothetical protein